MRTGKKAGNLLMAAGLAMLAAACGLDVEQDYLVEDPNQKGGMIYESELAGQQTSVFGDDGFNFLDIGRKKARGAGDPGIAVNSFLWRASLDTIAFMPLSSADPFGGVIITDWYSPPEAPQERYKMSVYILGRELRADGVKVAVFRQRANGANGWAPSVVSKDTAANLENQILTRARQLRVASAQAP